MARKEISDINSKNDKKLRMKELIFAGAFAAVYIVVMLMIVMIFGSVPILYIISPLAVGIVCATIYEFCLRIIELEKSELHQEKIIEADHFVSLVDREYHHEAKEELLVLNE